MSEFLFQYEKVSPISWAYLASLLMIALFFKFNRFWSVRNLDLILLILLAPGLLVVQAGRRDLRQVRVEQANLQKSQDTAVARWHAKLKQMEVVPASFSEPVVNPTAPSNPSVSPLVLAEAAVEEAEGPLATETPPVGAEDPPSPDLPIMGPALQQLAARESAATTLLWRGYAGLLGVCVLLLIRLLFDPTMVRRPLLEPNLNTGGLLFLAAALFIFLMANVVTSQVTAKDLRGAQGAQAILGTDTRTPDEKIAAYRQYGPGYFMLHLLPSVITPAYGSDAAVGEPSGSTDAAPGVRQDAALVAVSKTMAILAHLAILSAMIFIGYWHFENIKMGIGAATLYLILPYTSQMTGHVDHVLPSALLLWAIVLYRRPAMAGLLIGVAMSTVYYPFFLLPLWLSFYWQRGVMRFVTGLLVAVGAMVLSLVFVSESAADFWNQVLAMFGLWIPKMDGLAGIWAYGWDPVYRLPIIAACVALGGSLALWPAQKNLGTLLSCSAAVMVAIQFWHGHGDGGGMYLAWFLPLALLTVFRPNLEDRVALTVLGEDWFTRRRAKLAQLKRTSGVNKGSIAAFNQLRLTE